MEMVGIFYCKLQIGAIVLLYCLRQVLLESRVASNLQLSARDTGMHHHTKHERSISLCMDVCGLMYIYEGQRLTWDVFHNYYSPYFPKTKLGVP